MKIAVLSDIHGNMPALEAVLSEISHADMDHIIFLGDLITDFAQYTKEILKTVRCVSPYVIRGNREGYLIQKANNPDDDTWEKYRQFSTNRNTFRYLSGEDLSYIKALPQQMSFPIGRNVHLRAVHGSPFSESDAVYANDTEKIVRSLNKIDENILLCGHTHRPFVYSAGEKTLINAGSVGLNFKRQISAQYTVIHYTDGDIQIDMKKVKYDYAAFRESCDLDDPWVYLCLKSMEDGDNYNMRFLREAKKRCGAWTIPNDVYNDLFQEWCEKGIV